jgi:hypothetical protein
VAFTLTRATRAERLEVAIAAITNPDISRVYCDFPARFPRELGRILGTAGAGLKAVLALPNYGFMEKGRTLRLSLVHLCPELCFPR